MHLVLSVQPYDALFELCQERANRRRRVQALLALAPPPGSPWPGRDGRICPNPQLLALAQTPGFNAPATGIA